MGKKLDEEEMGLMAELLEQQPEVAKTVYCNAATPCVQTGN